MFLRKTVPTIIASISGVVVVVAYFFQITPIGTLADHILKWRSVIAVFALGLGGVNIIRLHTKNIQRDPKNFYSAALLLTFAITIVVGLTMGQTSAPYTFIFDYINVPTGSAIFSPGVLHRNCRL